MSNPLKTFQFPKMNKANVAFPTMDAPKILLEEARNLGFYNGDTPANKLFNKWFFSGLDETPEFKEGVDKDLAQDAMNFAVVLMRSFAPKHEHKEAVCALIFSECLEL